MTCMKKTRTSTTESPNSGGIADDMRKNTTNMNRAHIH